MSPTESKKVPHARSEGLLTQKVADEAVVYDLGTKEAHCLKPLAAFVFDASDGSATIGQLASRARAEVDPGVTDEQVADAVAQLEQIRLLEAPPLIVVDGDGGVSRRDMMRRMGYAGAAATVGTGLVMSIAAPTALAACTGQGGGCSCSMNKQCASGHCCQPVASKCNANCCTTTNNGAECKCLSNGTCASPGNATNCCLGVCTPTTTCTTGASTTHNNLSQTTTNGGTGNLSTPSTPGGASTPGGGNTLTSPSTPGGGTPTTPSTPGGGTATTPSTPSGGSLSTP